MERITGKEYGERHRNNLESPDTAQRLFHAVFLEAFRLRSEALDGG